MEEVSNSLNGTGNRFGRLATTVKKTATFSSDYDLSPERESVSKYTPLSRTDFDMSIIDQWIEVKCSNAPKRRCNHISFIYKEELFIFGGMDINEGKMADFYKISLSAGYSSPRWVKIETVGAIPEALSNQAGDIIENCYYMFGGENNREEMNNNLYILNIEEKKWEKRIFIEKDIPCLINHSCTYSKNTNQLFVFGGFNKGRYLNSIYTFDIKKLDWEKIITTDVQPEGRISHSATMIDNSIMIIFGGKNDQGAYLNDFWKFSTLTKIWEEIIVTKNTEVPKGRSGHSATFYDNNIYIFGGKVNNIQERNDFWKYNIISNSFTLMHDSLLEQFHEMPYPDERSNSLKRSKYILIKNNLEKTTSEIQPMVLNPISTLNNSIIKKKSSSPFSKTAGNMKTLKKGRKDILNSLHNGNKINHEDLVLASPTTKKMKASLIFKMDTADSHILKQRVSTLLVRSLTISDKNMTKMGSVPAPRDGHSANLYNDKMIIFGGDRNKFPFNDFSVFNF